MSRKVKAARTRLTTKVFTIVGSIFNNDSEGEEHRYLEEREGGDGGGVEADATIHKDLQVSTQPQSAGLMSILT